MKIWRDCGGEKGREREERSRREGLRERRERKRARWEVGGGRGDGGRGRAKDRDRETGEGEGEGKKGGRGAGSVWGEEGWRVSEGIGGGRVRQGREGRGSWRGRVRVSEWVPIGGHQQSLGEVEVEVEGSCASPGGNGAPSPGPRRLAHKKEGGLAGESKSELVGVRRVGRLAKEEMVAKRASKCHCMLWNCLYDGLTLDKKNFLLAMCFPAVIRSKSQHEIFDKNDPGRKCSRKRR
jgi:hypothetical protein